MYDKDLFDKAYDKLFEISDLSPVLKTGGKVYEIKKKPDNQVDVELVSIYPDYDALNGL